MAENKTDQEFLEFLVKSIVDNPEAVKVERKVDEMGVLLTLQVHQKDMGQVVGRAGATSKAIRALLRIVGIKNNARVTLKIVEPEGSTREYGGSANQTTGEAKGPVDQAMEDLKL